MATQLPNHVEDIQRMQQALDNELVSSLERVLEYVVKSVPSIANELDKPCPEIVFYECEAKIRPSAASFIVDVFTHLIRNCLDHGLESKEERVKAKKPVVGRITITSSLKKGMLEISIKDNGRGLNLQQLFKKGVEMELFTEKDDPAPIEIAELIFESGLSTKPEVTNISGRGVGMDAVKTFLQKHDCRVSVKLNAYSDKDAFAEFEVIVTLIEDYFFVESQELSCIKSRAV